VSRFLWFSVISIFCIARSLAEGELPRALLIGDSISIGYTPFVVEAMKREAYVEHHKGNAGDTWRGLEALDEWLGEGDWDVIHFNWGLWDLCYRHPDSKVQGRRDKIRGAQTTSLVQYEANLDTLVQRLKRTGAKLIWASITVVPENESGRFAGDEILYNKAAMRVMQRHGVPANDLHALTKAFSHELFRAAGDVHYVEEGSRRVGEQVAEAIRNSLK